MSDSGCGVVSLASLVRCVSDRSRTGCGVVLQGSSCSPTASTVSALTRPHCLTAVRLLSDSRLAVSRPISDCSCCRIVPCTVTMGYLDAPLTCLAPHISFVFFSLQIGCIFAFAYVQVCCMFSHLSDPDISLICFE